MAGLFCERFDGLTVSCLIRDGAVTALSFGERKGGPEPLSEDEALWRRVREELAGYFAGERREFDLPLRAGGTAFQRLVWQELLKIPYGQTRSYGQIAGNIGKPGAARAVGGACHVNPICLLIPCHRVVGAGGTLGGFGGGLELKEKLLGIEGVRLKRTP